VFVGTILLLAGLPLPVSAQTTWDVGVGYQFPVLEEVVMDGFAATYPGGFIVDVSVGVTDTLRLVAEGGWSRGKNYGALSEDEVLTAPTLTTSAYGGGLRWVSGSEGIARYMQVIAGIHRATTSSGDEELDAVLNQGANSFMVQPGCGIFIPVARGVGVVGQADYRFVFREDVPPGRHQIRALVGRRVGR
jgi:hypothetical protein